PLSPLNKKLKGFRKPSTSKSKHRKSVVYDAFFLLYGEAMKARSQRSAISFRSIFATSTATMGKNSQKM
ncbi:MAG: hypothetical protein IJX99_07940, partial [Clostridia bacterium]|nr:hypothetical protein [Clostridia bacterium]